MMPQDKFNIGDIVEYTHDPKFPEYANRDGSIGIIVGGPTLNFRDEVSYTVAWIVSMHPWDNPDNPEYRDYLLKPFLGKLVRVDDDKV